MTYKKCGGGVDEYTDSQFMGGTEDAGTQTVHRLSHYLDLT
jgi:hypothetical protein